MKFKSTESFERACQTLAAQKDPLIAARAVKALSDTPPSRQYNYNRAALAALESGSLADDQKQLVIDHLSEFDDKTGTTRYLAYNYGTYYVISIRPYVIAKVLYSEDIAKEHADEKRRYWSEDHSLGLQAITAISPTRWEDIAPSLAEYAANQFDSLDNEQ